MGSFIIDYIFGKFIILQFRSSFEAYDLYRKKYIKMINANKYEDFMINIHKNTDSMFNTEKF